MVFLLVIGGFLAGSIPFGVVVAKRLGVDIRTHGSGNIGASNVTRVLGPVAGAIVLLLDAGKGALPVYLALHVTWDLTAVVATGAAAIAGHCFSPFLEFRGGKGVATSFGVFVVLTPELALGAVIVFLFVLAATRTPALASLVSIIMLAGIAAFEQPFEIAALAVGTATLLLYTHRSNLKKLMR